MKCEEAKSLLTRYLLGDLDESQAPGVRAHIQECAACSAEADETQLTLDLLRGALADTAPAPARLEKARHIRIYSERSKGRAIAWLTEEHPWARRAAVALVMLGFVGLIAGMLLPVTFSARGRRPFKMGETVSGPAAYPAAYSVFVEDMVAEVEVELPDEVQSVSYGGSVARSESPAPAADQPAPAAGLEQAKTLDRQREMQREIAIKDEKLGDRDLENKILKDHIRKLEVEIRRIAQPGGGVDTAIVIDSKEGLEREMRIGYEPSEEERRRFGIKAEEAFGLSAGFGGGTLGATGLGVDDKEDWKEMFSSFGPAMPAGNAISYKPGEDTLPAPVDPFGDVAPVRYDALSAPERPLAMKGFFGSRMPVARGSALASESVAPKVQAPARPAVEAVDAFEPAMEGPAEEVVTRENMPVPVLGRLLRSEDTDGDGLQPIRLLDKNVAKSEKKPESKSKKDTTREKLKSIVIPEIDFRHANINDTIAFLQEQSVAFDGDSARNNGGGSVDMVLALPASGASKPVDGQDPFAAAGPAADAQLITFSARYISLQEALDIVTQVSNLKYNIDDNGRVRITGKDAPESPIVNRMYDVPDAVAQRVASIIATNAIAMDVDSGWKDLCEQFGVKWPHGSSISYKPSVGKLFVANEPDNLVLFETVLNALDASKPREEDFQDQSRFKAYGVNPVINVSENAFSTFSIDVDTASYTLTRSYIEGGTLPPAEAVRTEEIVNFFDYDYKAPLHRTFSVYAMAAPSKFGHGQHLLKIGIKGRRLGREEQRRAALTFVIDTSGSMEKPERIGLVKKSLKMLVDNLNDEDIVNIVQYDSRARLVLSGVKAKEREKIKQTIDALQCSGSTNLEDGITRAYETAAKNFVTRGENRVLILSDGVANLGSTDAEEILAKVEKFRRQGIYCSVFGVGMGNYDDKMLESLANRGDGTYTYLDSEDEAKRLFVDDLAATLNTIARDVKIQVEFNKNSVKTFRQLGYENRQLKKEQFRDDTVDAGEVGSGQSVTALYEIGLNQAAAGDAQMRQMAEVIATVRVRYRRVDNDAVEEIEIPVTLKDFVNDFDKADVRFRLAACAAEFAEILRGSPYAQGSSFEQVSKVLAPVKLELDLDQRVQELYRLTTAAPGMARGN